MTPLLVLLLTAQRVKGDTELTRAESRWDRQYTMSQGTEQHHQLHYLHQRQNHSQLHPYQLRPLQLQLHQRNHNSFQVLNVVTQNVLYHLSMDNMKAYTHLNDLQQMRKVLLQDVLEAAFSSFPRGWMPMDHSNLAN